MWRLGGQLDGFVVDERGDLGDRHRLLGHAYGFLDGQPDRGCEAPGPVDNDPDTKAEVLPVVGSLQGGVAQPEALGADALEPEVGM